MNGIDQKNPLNINFAERVYAGVLGKIIGVYLGRPVEGWSYDKIQHDFGEISYYVNDKLGMPLIVADDDISGTFGFFRALEDYDCSQDITSRDFGNTWLNYIIEHKTILWWGGLGRSTEHTAYIRLKNGLSAPESGSASLNGRTLSEQIGAQIFIDAIAMTCPGEPDKAIELVRKSASVSHDGFAVDAACFLAALESLAFFERQIDRLIETGLKFITNRKLTALVDSVVNICSKNNDWRNVRELLNDKYGYHQFDGPCPIETNHAAVIASLLLGEDDFQRAVMVAASMGWDTDCNAGSIGCLNGIRLGLNSISSKVDFRTAVADKMLVVTSDSGSCVTDAVQESKKIIRAAAKLHKLDSAGISKEKFTFEFPGSLQGFSVCPYSDHMSQSRIVIKNKETGQGERALSIELHNCSDSTPIDISTPTHVDSSELSNNFTTFSSPTLYTSQVVETLVSNTVDGLVIQPYILAYDIDNRIWRLDGKKSKLKKDINTISFNIPETCGQPIIRLGYTFSSEWNISGEVHINSIDWNGAPLLYEQKGLLMKSIWDIQPEWMKAWASSARHFAPDFKYTYCISHDDGQGLVTQGGRDWRDYSVESTLIFNLHNQGGLVLRSVGHRRFYACLFHDGQHVSIIRFRDDTKTILAEFDFSYEEGRPYSVRFSAVGMKLSAVIDGNELLNTEDADFEYGAAGFLVDNGTMLADGFTVQRLSQ